MGASSGRSRGSQRRGPHPRGLESLTVFVAAMARRQPARGTRALRAFRRAGGTRAAAEEAALMLVLHVGYPAALEALRHLNAAWPDRPSRARAGVAPREGGPREWRRRGERLCRRVYGPAYARLRENVERLHPALAVWMIEQGYGRVLSRPRLSAASRELVAVAVLAATGWERQLVSHLLGAVRLGCDRAAVRRAFRMGAGSADGAGRRAAARAWRAAFER